MAAVRIKVALTGADEIRMHFISIFGMGPSRRERELARLHAESDARMEAREHRAARRVEARMIERDAEIEAYITPRLQARVDQEREVIARACAANPSAWSNGLPDDAAVEEIARSGLTADYCRAEAAKRAHPTWDVRAGVDPL